MTGAGVRLDICVLADTRLGDGSVASHAAGLSALADLGYRIGILAVRPDCIPCDTGAEDPALARFLAEGRATRLAPGARIDCRFALALDSRLFAETILAQVSIVARNAVVLVERPAHLSGLSQTGLDRIAARAEAVLGAPPIWAPTNVLARDGLAHLAPHWPVTAADWPLPLPDFAPLPADALQRTRPVAGRARLARVRGQADVPDLAQLADPRLSWRLRLAPDAQHPAWPQPAPVEIWPDSAIDLASFMARIDTLPLPDQPAIDPCPVEALLALAAGVIPVLDPGYRPVFAGAALYSTTAELPRRLVELHDDAALQADLRAEGAALLARLHRPQDFARRIAALAGPPRPDSFAPAILSRPTRNILFYATNGIGMGHLTRQLAIARRLPPHLAPCFISHSQAVDVVRGFGYPAEHLPYHSSYRQNRAHWNAALADRLDAAIAFWRPAAVVFDGNVPFRGLIDALHRRPETARAWVRRGLWGKGRDPEALDLSPAFDLILEPGEAATVLDDGPTALRQSEAVQLPPVRLLDPFEQPPRAEACAALGLDPAAINVLLAPGSGNNSETRRLVDAALSQLSARPGIGVALAEWRIATAAQTLPPGVVRLTDYPFAASLNAFDFAIAAAGYNTFAEHLAAALPTIWTPNEHPEQDQQILRATFATRSGLGLTLRLTEAFHLSEMLTQMLNPACRATFRTAGLTFAARVMARNGASDAAAALAALCDSIASRNLSVPEMVVT